MELTDGLTRRAPAFAYQLTELKSQVAIIALIG
jgi:hypothetical protein